MSIDERIKRELESDEAEIDEIIRDEKGLFNLLAAGYKGGMRRWVWLMNIVAIGMVIIMLWSGYEFFTAEPSEQLFWGVILVLSTQMQAAIKQWLFSEMQRSMVMREIKRVEIAVARLRKDMA